MSFHEVSDDEIEQEEVPVRRTMATPLYTVILIAAYGCVFAAQMATGLPYSVEAAGFDKRAFTDSHEYWRILTGACLHGGILHIVLNSYAFLSFGRVFEMVSDRANLAVVFLLSAIAGNIGSLFLGPVGISVGASGGIVGLIGYLVVYAFRRPDVVTTSFRNNLLLNIGLILAYGLFLSGIVDNWAHIGGLIAGAVYALIQVPSDHRLDPRYASQPLVTAGFASLGAYIAICLFAILVMLRVV